MKRLNVLTLRGFTLIELLIVITIVGILIVGLVPRIVGAPAKARDATRLADLSQIATALEGYFSDVGRYPSSDPVNNPAAHAVICMTGTTYGTILDDYIRGIPTDPQDTNTTTVSTVNCAGSYLYEPLLANTTLSGFYLVANVENVNSGNTVTTGMNAIENVGSVPTACDNTNGNAADDCDYYFLMR